MRTPCAEQEGHTERLPAWFKVSLTTTARSAVVRRLVKDHNLHTVCQSAACPNQTECWNSGTATFMILGDTCTRGCGFCNVKKGTPVGLDMQEAVRVAKAVSELRLNYAVITSVTRDDLPDGGAALFAATIMAIRAERPSCRVEVLIPDLNGSASSLGTVLAAGPDVLNHNIETVPSQYVRVRPQAGYRRSLDLLGRAHAQGAVTKSGLMLGLGEEGHEVINVMKDLRQAGCSILTLGQYLQPGKSHLPVSRYYHPDEFDLFREQALSLGFEQVVSGPLVRSSYRAGQHQGAHS